jgi:predicted nucleic acid-binding Zn ribbon protein
MNMDNSSPEKPLDDAQAENRLLEDLQNRSRAIGPRARTLKSVLKNWQIQRNLSSESIAIMTVEVWREIVGDILASYTRPGNIKRGALEIYVDSPLVMQELSMQKRQILASLQQRLPDHHIKSLRLKSH